MNKNKVEMVALRATYYQTMRAEGERFFADPQHVRILTAMKSAKVFEAPDRKTYKRRDMRAES